MKKALITGINGQDGSYLCEYLLDEGYEVSGVIRRQSVSENQTNRIDHILQHINAFYGDITDQIAINNILEKVKPDEIYNLAAMSHVKVSFEIPSFTLQTNGLGVLNMLEGYKKIAQMQNFIKQVHLKCLAIQLIQISRND
tara:strand:+ start:624 stop:1046 length:423 start_codon:yes stop_codon:yes gene_type:complete